MSTLVQLRGSPEGWLTPAARPLNEAIWQAWTLKGRARESRNSAARLVAITWAAAGALLAAAAVWPHPGIYSVVVRFVVLLGAVAVMLGCLHIRQYAVAAAFGLLALLYNPVLPVIPFQGDWQRALVAASAVPFIIAAAAFRAERPAGK